MTSKQRVHAALRREPVDQVLIFMWFHPETIARLGRLLEIPPAHVDEVMGNDVKMTWVNNNYAMEGIVHEHDGESHVDFWGIEWTKDGPFNQISRFPLAEASVPQMLQYDFPWQHQEALLGRMEPLLASRQDYFIGCDVSPCVFEMYWRLRGMDRALLDMAAEPEMTEALFGRCADFAAMLSEEATSWPLLIRFPRKRPSKTSSPCTPRPACRAKRSSTALPRCARGLAGQPAAHRLIKSHPCHARNW